MEKMSVFFLIIIVLYLIYAFIKSKMVKEEEKKQTCTTAEKYNDEKKDVYDYEKFAVAAAIAAVMGDTSYKIKRIFLTGKTDEKKSSWKISGRNESMMRRVFFNK